MKNLGGLAAGSMCLPEQAFPRAWGPRPLRMEELLWPTGTVPPLLPRGVLFPASARSLPFAPNSQKLSQAALWSAKSPYLSIFLCPLEHHGLLVLPFSHRFIF